ncbi:hypothetical protein BH09PSE5_BH09PSE5_45790 [soil metagenome]
MTSFGSSIQNDIPTIWLSVLIAILATYSALDLAGRVHGAIDALGARLWISAGAVAMGSGIWAMLSSASRRLNCHSPPATKASAA